MHPDAETCEHAGARGASRRRRAPACLQVVFRPASCQGTSRFSTVKKELVLHYTSAECASASENTEATGDPCAPLARLSAPPGQGRLAPPHRTGRCVRSGRDGRAPSGERRADAMRRRSATRFGGKVAEGNRVATRKRPRSPHAPQMTRQSVASSQVPPASRGGIMRGSSNEIRSFIF